MRPITERTKKIERGCHCKCGNHEAAMAPVAYLIERDGVEMRVCTRCDLSSDKKLARLVSKAMPAQPFHDFDILGAFCLIGDFETLPIESEYRKAQEAVTV